MQRQEHEVRSDANPLGDSSNRGCDRQNRRRVSVFGEVMLCQPDLVVAKVFGESRLRELIGIEVSEGLAPRRRVSKRKQQPDVQIPADTHRLTSTRILCTTVPLRRCFFKLRITERSQHGHAIAQTFDAGAASVGFSNGGSNPYSAIEERRGYVHRVELRRCRTCWRDHSATARGAQCSNL